MDNFIGNHVKLLAEWGQLIVGVIFLTCMITGFLTLRKNKYYLPKDFWAYLGTFGLLLLMMLCTLIFLRIQKVKPGVMAIINQLENVKGQSPPLTFSMVNDSGSVNIQDFKGKVVLLNFWATWCKPCLAEMPDLNRLHETYKDKGLAVIVLSDESRDRLIKFMEKKPMQVVSGFVTEFSWATMGSERPVTFLIDRKGVVVDYYTGAYDFEFFESEVSKLL